MGLNREATRYKNWICTLPCSICGGGTYHDEVSAFLTDPCHVRSKGSTGGRVHFNNLVPMCRTHHQLQHTSGWSALEKFNFGRPRAAEYAAELTRRWVVEVEKEKSGLEAARAGHSESLGGKESSKDG